jgi:hypothetical protein
VLVTRPDAQAGQRVAALAGRGLEAVVVPAIEIEPSGPGGELDARLADLRSTDWVIVTSPNGAESVAAALRRIGADPSASRWAAIGEATAATLAADGVRVAFRPTRANGQAIARTAVVPAARSSPAPTSPTVAARARAPVASRRRGRRLPDKEAPGLPAAPGCRLPDGPSTRRRDQPVGAARLLTLADGAAPAAALPDDPHRLHRRRPAAPPRARLVARRGPDAASDSLADAVARPRDAQESR